MTIRQPFVPPLAAIILSVGVSSYLICLGYQTTQANDISLQVANTKLEATRKLNDARLQSSEVKTYIEQIEAQSVAYNELLAKYTELAKTHPGVRKLKPEIEKVQAEAASTENIEALKTKVSNTEKSLGREIKDLTSE